jgi:hypothetical protein
VHERAVSTAMVPRTFIHTRRLGCNLLSVCGLTPKLSCKRSAHQAAHQYAGLSALQPLNRNASAASRACRLQRHVRARTLVASRHRHERDP